VNIGRANASIPIPIAIAIPIPIPIPIVAQNRPDLRWLLPTRDTVGVHCLPGPCTTNLKILAKKERIFQHHGITVGVGIGIAIAVAIAIENCA